MTLQCDIPPRSPQGRGSPFRKPSQPSGVSPEVAPVLASTGAVTPSHSSSLVLASAAASAPVFTSASTDPLTLISAIVETLVSPPVVIDPLQSTTATEISKAISAALCQRTKEIYFAQCLPRLFQIRWRPPHQLVWLRAAWVIPGLPLVGNIDMGHQGLLLDVEGLR